MASEGMDAREEFENCFLHFIQALQVLSHDATTQCEEMNNYNPPWEIQHDTTSSGLGSLRLSAPYLSWEQAKKLSTWSPHSGAYQRKRYQCRT